MNRLSCGYSRNVDYNGAMDMLKRAGAICP